jgi:hypothetical protein
MAALVPGFEPLRVEGDLFSISDEAIAVLDRLELAGPYVRATIAVASPEGAREAQAYLVADPAGWRALVEAGAAEALPAYPRDLASAEEPKPCCVRDPGHAPPHDVIDPLRDLLAG